MSSPWRLLVDDGADAAGGLALDESLMAGYHRGQVPRLPTLRLYTYRDHCALVGRYQHLAAEVDVGAELRPDAEEQRAGELRRERYEADSWLMCSTPQPDATATATIRTSAGMLRVYLALQGDVVKSALFTGDVNELPPQLAQLESVLKWQRLDPVTLPGTVEDFYRSSPIPDIPAASVVGALLEAGARAAPSTARGAPERRGSCYFPEAT